MPYDMTAEVDSDEIKREQGQAAKDHAMQGDKLHESMKRAQHPQIVPPRREGTGHLQVVMML